MDFEIPEWDNESFSYHLSSSLDQTVIDTAISNAGNKVKKRKKKPKSVDNSFSPNKKQKNIENNCETTKSSIDIAQSPKDKNEVKEKNKLKKKKKLKISSIDDSTEFEPSYLETNENDSVEKSISPKKAKSKKKKKSGKHNKYKELNEKQKLERNDIVTTSDKADEIPTLKKTDGKTEWTVSNVIGTENKTQKLDLTKNDSLKSNFVNDEGTKENKKNSLKKESQTEHINANDNVLMGTENSDIISQTVSRKPNVNNENNVIKNQQQEKTLKNKKKKKNKVKSLSVEDEGNQEKVTGSISDVSIKQQKIKEIKRIDANNIELNKLAKETDSNLNKKKKKKHAQQKVEEESTKKQKGKKSKSKKISFENDMEVIEDEDESIDDSDLKAELERYLGKLKSMKNEELFADDSEDEKMKAGKDNESDEEEESVEEEDEPGDEPGDDLDNSAEVEEETGDNLKESDDDTIKSENYEQDKEMQDNDDDESEHDSNDLDSVEDDNESVCKEDENESESDLDSIESEKDEIDSDDKSTKDNHSTSIIVKHKDSKKKKFDLEKLSALLQEAEPIKTIPQTISPADALRQRMSLQLNSARFRLINEQLYTSTGDDAKKMFGKDPEAFQVYHEGYKSQVAKWPINPLDLIINWLKTKPAELVVADFGCGEAELSQSVPQKKVFSLDLQAASDGVIVCDMAHTPLKTASVNIAVFCLSLMGTNIKDYVCEANRVLKQEGILKVAEVESRFTGDIGSFIKAMEKYGFKSTAKDTSNKFFFIFEFKKLWVPKKSYILPDISLKPCIYKKR